MPVVLAEPSAIVQWLQDPVKATAFITGVGGAIVGLVVKVAAALEKARRDRAEAAIPPSTTTTGPILPPPSVELQELRTRLREVERDQDIGRLRWRYEASLEERQELRIELERLQNALTTERRRTAELEARLDALATPAETLRTPLLPPGRT